MAEDVNENKMRSQKIISNHSPESVSGLFIQAAQVRQVDIWGEKRVWMHHNRDARA